MYMDYQDTWTLWEEEGISDAQVLRQFVLGLQSSRS